MDIVKEIMQLDFVRHGVNGVSGLAVGGFLAWISALVLHQARRSMAQSGQQAKAQPSPVLLALATVTGSATLVLMVFGLISLVWMVTSFELPI